MLSMSKHPHQERTLVLLKPDTVQRSLIGEIIGRFERVGLKLTAMKMVMPTEKQLEDHYNKDDEWYLKKGERMVEDLKANNLPVEKEAIEYGRDIIRVVVRYMKEAPVIALVLEGNKAVDVVTKLTGTTEPSTSDVGTIRGDFTIDSYEHSTYENRGVKNLIHCSETPEEAERELKLWFTEEEVHDYVTAQERIMYETIRMKD